MQYVSRSAANVHKCFWTRASDDVTRTQIETNAYAVPVAAPWDYDLRTLRLKSIVEVRGRVRGTLFVTTVRALRAIGVKTSFFVFYCGHVAQTPRETTSPDRLIGSPARPAAAGGCDLLSSSSSSGSGRLCPDSGGIRRDEMRRRRRRANGVNCRKYRRGETKIKIKPREKTRLIYRSCARARTSRVGNTII